MLDVAPRWTFGRGLLYNSADGAARKEDSGLLDCGGSSMRILTLLTHSWRSSFGILIAACLVLGDAGPAAASVVYDFSLAANGEVGAINIEVTLADFLPAAGLNVFDLSAPEVSAFSSDIPIDAPSSFIGLDVTTTSTLVGIRLASAISEVLTTLEYPNDFFVFDRTVTQVGTFLSSAGTVVSDFSLDTTTPTATLVVTTVPEPASAVLLTFGVVGAVAWRRRRRTPA
jgi:PEP-CTERM motif